MLVLTHKVGDVTYIGDDIVLTVVKNHSGHIVIGIDAPKHIDITRAKAKHDKFGKPRNVNGNR